MKGFTNTSATLFNYHDNPETGKEEYHVTHFRDVYWENTTVSTVTLTGAAPSAAVVSQTQVFIWPDVDADGKTYVSPRVYARMIPAEARMHWTVRDGQDYLAKGIVDAPETVDSPQKTSVGASELMRVQAATTCDYGPFPHWEIAGVNA